MNQPDSLDTLREALRAFAAARDWEQFHSPKNLAMSVMIEAAELGEHFQWRPTGEAAELPPGEHDRIALEMADVLLYLVRLADRLDIDLAAAAWRKLALNAERYPAELARGSAAKYTEL